MERQERRQEERFGLSYPMQYERMLSDGTFTKPTESTFKDLGLRGVGFYAQENIDIDSKVRIKFSLAEDEIVTMIGRVARRAISDQPDADYIIGVEAEKLAEKDREKIDHFIHKVNIHSILEGLDLKDVTDVHFVSGYPPLVKKVGKLIEQKEPLLNEDVLRSMLLSMLDSGRYKKFREEKELNFVFAHRGKTRFRVNLHIQQRKVEATFRLISSQIGSPTKLGFPPSMEKLLENVEGLIIVAGPAGCGKTTTLASMVEFLNNTRKGLVISIEQPVEYLHINKLCIIKQREVGIDTLSFSNAAKNALRQSPDVLVIGEILDVETMEVAITAAESGMLVLTSIHATDVSQALDRVVSFFPADLQKHILTRLSLVLKGLVAQELLPRLDAKGLTVAAEILLANNALRHVIRIGDWKQIVTIIQTGRNIGMQTMQESLEQLCQKGLIGKEYLRE